MGFFYTFHSLALSEDLPGIERSFSNADDFHREAEAGYTKVSSDLTQHKCSVCLNGEQKGQGLIPRSEICSSFGVRVASPIARPNHLCSPLVSER
jgi:hypothetical protein